MTDKDLQIQFVAQNKDGNYYVVYKIPNVKRGIGKNADELLIWGFNKSQLDKVCKRFPEIKRLIEKGAK